MKRNGMADEAGVALAMAIMVVVIAGVMGAGLLVVIANDLEGTISAGESRRAYDAADAGVLLARRHLLADPRPESYDDAGYSGKCRPPETKETETEEPLEDSGWSYSAGGESRDFGGTGSGVGFTVRILALGDGCGVPRDGGRYFRVYSEGHSGGSRRLIEATYRAEKNGAPRAVYAAKDAVLGSSAEVIGGSVFVGGDARLEGGATVSGEDTAYGDWRSVRNRTGRGTTNAAVAAVGGVSGGGAVRYDSKTKPAFAGVASGGALTYPFDPAFWSGEARRAFMEEVSREQGLVVPEWESGWPDGTGENSVVYVESGSAVLGGAGCPEEEPCRGVLFVADGGVVVESGAVFRGAIIAPQGDVTVEEGAEVRGSVVAGGNLRLDGGIVATEEAGYAPGNFRLEVRTWREPSG